jgi:hypothetical protein
LSANVKLGHLDGELTWRVAPAGTDSSRNAAVGGDDLRKSRLGIDAEHEAKVKPHAMTAMTLLMT